MKLVVAECAEELTLRHSAVWKFKAQLLRRVQAWITHPSDLRSRLAAMLRMWATTAPKVCACDAQCCRENRHVHCGPSTPTLSDPSVAA